MGLNLRENIHIREADRSIKGNYVSKWINSIYRKDPSKKKKKQTKVHKFLKSIYKNIPTNTSVKYIHK
jgi:hypothetical protein